LPRKRAERHLKRAALAGINHAPVNRILAIDSDRRLYSAQYLQIVADLIKQIVGSWRVCIRASPADFDSNDPQCRLCRPTL
jgi:hypothetical protein